MSHEAVLVHSVPGRLRLKITAARGDVEYFRKLTEGLLALPGVTEVHAREITGSILIGHPWRSSEPLAIFGRDSGLFELKELALEPIAQQATVRVQRLHERMMRLTRGEVGIRSAALVALMALGLAQTARGQFLAPASSLLWYALQLAGIPQESPRPVRARSVI